MLNGRTFAIKVLKYLNKLTHVSLNGQFYLRKKFCKIIHFKQEFKLNVLCDSNGITYNFLPYIDKIDSVDDPAVYNLG